MSALAVRRVAAWEALDSRGTPTVGCRVELAGGASGAAAVPSGASTGTHEAHELRDGGERYAGLGVRNAVRSVENELAAAVRNLDASDQRGLDAALRAADGTADLGRLGANAVLAVSVAAALAAAAARHEPLYRVAIADGVPLLPLPMVNILSGGAHAGWAVDLQDFLAVPVGACSFAEALEWAWRVRRAAAEIVAERELGGALVADEGGLGPALASNVEALEILTLAIESAGLEPASEVAIAIDVAATQLLASDGRYRLRTDGRTFAAEELIDALLDWTSRFPIVSVEDPLAEDDWAGWRAATQRARDLQLLGDDLFVTDLARLERGIADGVANAVLVKPNQTGTLSGALDVVRRASEAGYATVLSARSGDTEDAWLADLAVAWRTGQIKVGSTMRSERTAKWNRLLQIEAELGGEGEFAGRTALAAGVA